jgi:hypothetical protein
MAPKHKHATASEIIQAIEILPEAERIQFMSLLDQRPELHPKYAILDRDLAMATARDIVDLLKLPEMIQRLLRLLDNTARLLEESIRLNGANQADLETAQQDVRRLRDCVDRERERADRLNHDATWLAHKLIESKESKERRNRKPSPDNIRRNAEICKLREQDRKQWTLEKLRRTFKLGTTRAVTKILTEPAKWRQLATDLQRGTN